MNDQNIIPMHPNSTSVPTNNRDIIDLRDKQEETIMSQEIYSKTEIDLKFENLETKVDSKFDLLMQKMDDGFDKVNLSIDKKLSDFKSDLLTEQRKDKKEFTYWLVGILISSIIGIAAIIVTILTAK